MTHSLAEKPQGPQSLGQKHDPASH